MLVFEVIRSITMGDLKGCPLDNRAPLTAWMHMEERRREKVRRQHSQHMVLL